MERSIIRADLRAILYAWLGVVVLWGGLYGQKLNTAAMWVAVGSIALPFVLLGAGLWWLERLLGTSRSLRGAPGQWSLALLLLLMVVPAALFVSLGNRTSRYAALALLIGVAATALYANRGRIGHWLSQRPTLFMTSFGVLACLPFLAGSADFRLGWNSFLMLTCFFSSATLAGLCLCDEERGEVCEPVVRAAKFAFHGFFLSVVLVLASEPSRNGPLSFLGLAVLMVLHEKLFVTISRDTDESAGGQRVFDYLSALIVLFVIVWGSRAVPSSMIF